MFCKAKTFLLCTIKRTVFSGNLKPIEIFPLSEKCVDIKEKMKFENNYDKFKLILDVRSPCEYDDDHIPRAINIPILSNDERSTVGKAYESSNPLPARLIGSSLIMNNLSKYLQPDGILFDNLKKNITDNDDQILVYCWRGGQRSKSVALVLSEISVNKQPIGILNGGYKSYRRHVIDSLNHLTKFITFIGICGLTGTGKTKILNYLKSRGEIVLDLEHLAEHKGSIFGSSLKDLRLEGHPMFVQLSQKMFESRLYQELIDIHTSANGFKRYKDDKLIVWVECESRNIGSVHLPTHLWNLIEQSKRIIIQTPIQERVKHIISEYNHWTSDSYTNVTLLMINWLSKTCSKSLINHWTELVTHNRFEELVQSLLTEHYDPIYKKNRQRFIDSKDETAVFKVDIESLDEAFLEKCVCSKLIDISKNLFS